MLIVQPYQDYKVGNICTFSTFSGQLATSLRVSFKFCVLGTNSADNKPFDIESSSGGESYSALTRSPTTHL